MRELILDGKIFSIFRARALHEKKKKKKTLNFESPKKIKWESNWFETKKKKKKNVIREK